ncbi:MAG TPA: Rrf2 family transcriptional regulator [Sphingomicrobium sp.]|nr:Rrf2 family transcriptional regulator [Sphingomicrobium sp.]
MLTHKTRYALRSLLYLAEEKGDRPVQLASIASSQRVPPKYLELIMLDLKKAGLVKSVRGPRGGYRLGRAPQEISFGEVVRAMEGPIALVPCASLNYYAPCGDCHDEATCAIRRAFAILRDRSSELLEGISLAEAASWEKADPALANGAAAGATERPA